MAERDRRHAVEARDRALLLRAVLGPADVAHADGHAVARGDDQVVEGARIDDAAHRAQRLLARRAGDVAAGQVGVLPRQRVAHGGDRQLIGGQPVGVDPDVDGALEAADDLDLADAGRALEKRLDDLVGDLGQLAQRPVGRERDGHDRRASRCRPCRRSAAARRAAGATSTAAMRSRTSCVAASMSRSSLKVAMTMELPAPETDRSSSRPCDRVDGLLDRLGDQHLDFFRRGAGQLRADEDRRQVHRREAIDAQPQVAGRADDDQAQDQHRGKHRTLDADRGELLHALRFPRDEPGRATPPCRAWAPCRRRRGPACLRPGCPGCAITGSPAARPSTISMRSASRRPTVTRFSIDLAVLHAEHLVHAGKGHQRRGRAR